MSKPSLIFFGSFQDYSTQVINAINQADAVDILAVVSTPPVSPPGGSAPSKTHTHRWAEKNNIPVFTPKTLNQDSLEQLSQLEISNFPPDFFLVAGYRNMLSKSWLNSPSVAPLNLHFSLLPKYRGANPAEWAILCGETETGVSLMHMDQHLDTGDIINQEKIPLTAQDTRETLYENLYSLAGKLFVSFIENWKLEIENSRRQPNHSPTPYAKLLRRDDGFIEWVLIEEAMHGLSAPLKDRSEVMLADGDTHLSIMLERATRALAGYPTLWTKVETKKGVKRMQILKSHIETKTTNNRQAPHFCIDQVKIEGYGSTAWSQIQTLLQD